MSSDLQHSASTMAELERRLAELAQSKSRLELINRLLTSLSAVAGLDNMVAHILDILMQTIGAANISIIFRLDTSWQYRDIFGENRLFCEPDHPDVAQVLADSKPLRINKPGMQVPYPGAIGSVPIENWIFPLLSQERKIGVICLDGMQLNDTSIFDELMPFFVYAGVMLDNEISNYSQLAEAHHRLQESEARMRLAISSSPIPIMIHDEDDVVLQLSDGWTDISGYSQEDIPTLADWTGLAYGERTGTKKEYIDTLFAIEHTVQNGEWTITAKDGSKKIWEFQTTPLGRTSSGKRVLLSMATDITERKRAEDERLHMEQQLLHAQKLESLGVLAGGIAHDFNNILMAIIGNADLALMRLSKESPAVENLHRIEQAAARAADLAKQMLAYSGKGKFVVENLDLNILLEEMLHMLEVSISKKAILRLNPHQHLPSVEADATQMRQIIMNLVINASEAIGDRSGVIAITTGCMDCDRSYLKDVWLDENLTDGLYVYLEIADTGCGMDRETLTKLFDPFFTTKFTGRGLGMAAVLGIIRGHKGAIKVYSELHKGTTFKILLPASGRPADLFNGNGHTNGDLGSGTVLLVDDEETIRGISTEMLKELGYTAITASDGREALEIYRSRTDIALVILDLTMPHVDGEQCFRELRQLNPAVKVIMSSGFNEHEVTQKFIGKGLTGFIQKPYRLSTLKNVIQEALTP